MEIKKELIKRQIAGETVLIPVGKAVYESNGLFALNEVGAFIWELLPRVEDPQQILEAVLAEYDVTEDGAKEDIERFLRDLEKLGIL